MSREGGRDGVLPGVACGGGQNRPPGTESPSGAGGAARTPPGAESPSGDGIALPVGLGSAEIGCFVALGRVELPWEGGSVGVLPGAACEGVQNRPPGTE